MEPDGAHWMMVLGTGQGATRDLMEGWGGGAEEAMTGPYWTDWSDAFSWEISAEKLDSSQIPERPPAMWSR